MTGNPTPYADDDYERLVKLLHAAFGQYGPGEPSIMTVKADIEWAGDYNPTRHRATTMDDLRGLNSRVRPQVEAAMAAWEAIPKPYTVGRPNIPVTFSGQLNWLTKTKAGRAHAETAGFRPSPRTLKRWAAGTQQPSKRNREALEAAGRRYHDQRISEWEARRDAADARRSAALGRFQAAARTAGDGLSSVMEQRYGVQIRLFNPTPPIIFGT